MSKNPLKGEFDRLKRIQRALADADRQARRDAPLSKGEHDQNRLVARLARRQKLLDTLVCDRRCPCCQRGPFLKSRQWIVFDVTKLGNRGGENSRRVRTSAVDGKAAVCRSCAMTVYKQELWR